MRQSSESLSFDIVNVSDGQDGASDAPETAQRRLRVWAISGDIVAVSASDLWRYFTKTSVIGIVSAAVSLFLLGLAHGTSMANLALTAMGAGLAYVTVGAILWGVAHMAVAGRILVPICAVSTFVICAGVSAAHGVTGAQGDLLTSLILASAGGLAVEYLMIQATDFMRAPQGRTEPQKAVPNLALTPPPPQARPIQASKRIPNKNAQVAPQVVPEEITIGQLRIVADSLVMLCAEEHYVRIVTRSETLLTRMTFVDAIARLSQMRGIQVHRSYWVADHAVSATRRADNGLTYLTMSNGEEVPVSRRRNREIKLRFSHLKA